MPEPPTTSLQQAADKVRYPVNFPGDLSKPTGFASNMLTPRPRSRLTEIRYKKKRGEPTTPEEDAIVAAANARYAPCKVTIHVRAQRKEAWQKMAEGSKSL